jgi:hypothetical protein
MMRTHPIPTARAAERGSLLWFARAALWCAGVAGLVGFAAGLGMALANSLRVA